MSDLEEQKSGVSRRTVAKAMAWSVPAVALAVPAPAYAASPCTPIISFGPTSCKCPGQSTGDPWGFYLNICATDAAGCDLPEGTTITITGVWSITAGGTELVPAPGNSVPFDLVVGSCSGERLWFGTNSGNFLYVTYEYNGVSGQTPNIDSPPECGKTAVSTVPCNQRG
jgi:hypothetical protein